MVARVPASPLSLLHLAHGLKGPERYPEGDSSVGGLWVHSRSTHPTIIYHCAVVRRC